MSSLLAFLLLIFFIFCLFAYAKALINAAESSKWPWFVAMLLFWPTFVFYYFGAYQRARRQNRG